jgi:hypothetical protein
MDSWLYFSVFSVASVAKKSVLPRPEHSRMDSCLYFSVFSVLSPSRGADRPVANFFYFLHFNRASFLGSLFRFTLKNLFKTSHFLFILVKNHSFLVIFRHFLVIFCSFSSVT